MPNEQFINSLLQHASVDGSKSTVLKPLGWALVMILPTVIISSYLQVDKWITIMFAVLLVLVFLLYMVAYIYFMINDSDALRSEKYSLKKMAIEKTMIGDSDAGMLLKGTQEQINIGFVEVEGSSNV